MDVSESVVSSIGIVKDSFVVEASPLLVAPVVAVVGAVAIAKVVDSKFVDGNVPVVVSIFCVLRPFDVVKRAVEIAKVVDSKFVVDIESVVISLIDVTRPPEVVGGANSTFLYNLLRARISLL